MSQATSRTPINSQPQLNKYGYNCIACQISLMFFVYTPLFIGAGTPRWDWAWIFTAVTLVGWVVLGLILARISGSTHHNSVSTKFCHIWSEWHANQLPKEVLI